MKRERWRTVFFLIILLILTLFVRLFFIQSNSSFIILEGDYYQKAMIGNYGVYRMEDLGLDELYTKALSIAMLFLGNYEIIGVYLNIILQTLAIIVIYVAIKCVASAYVAFLVAAVISLVPFYSDKVYEISAFHLLILFYAVGLLALAMVCKGVYMFAIRKKPAEQEKTIFTENVQEEQTGVITLDDIIGEHSSETAQEQKEEVTKEETEILPDGMKEIILDEEETRKKVKFLENPLPVPKRHERKEMDFAIELRGDNDDYDIKDVSGMDFFDIE